MGSTNFIIHSSASPTGVIYADPNSTDKPAVPGMWGLGSSDTGSNAYKNYGDDHKLMYSHLTNSYYPEDGSLYSFTDDPTVAENPSPSYEVDTSTNILGYGLDGYAYGDDLLSAEFQTAISLNPNKVIYDQFGDGTPYPGEIAHRTELHKVTIELFGTYQDNTYADVSKWCFADIVSINDCSTTNTVNLRWNAQYQRPTSEQFTGSHHDIEYNDPVLYPQDPNIEPDNSLLSRDMTKSFLSWGFEKLKDKVIDRIGAASPYGIAIQAGSLLLDQIMKQDNNQSADSNKIQVNFSRESNVIRVEITLPDKLSGQEAYGFNFLELGLPLAIKHGTQTDMTLHFKVIPQVREISTLRYSGEFNYNVGDYADQYSMGPDITDYDQAIHNIEVGLSETPNRYRIARITAKDENGIACDYQTNCLVQIIPKNNDAWVSHKDSVYDLNSPPPTWFEMYELSSVVELKPISLDPDNLEFVRWETYGGALIQDTYSNGQGIQILSDGTLRISGVDANSFYSQTGNFIQEIHAIFDIPPDTAPNKPDTPSGPGNKVTPSKSYQWDFKTTDIDSTDITFYVDWGDNTHTTADGKSGVTKSISHSYSSSGTYNIKVKAKSIHSDWSVWSDSKSVIVDAPPNKPYTPSGPGSALRYYSYNWSFKATDPDSSSITYDIRWGDYDTSSVTGSSGSWKSVSHVYLSTGTFSIRVRAKSANSAWSSWSNIKTVTVTNDQAPNKPDTPSGPGSSTKYGYDYWDFRATDPDTSSITFYIDWGDGSHSTVSGTSGVWKSVLHSYSSSGTFYIRVKAKSAHSSWSVWSNYKSVSVASSGGGGGGGGYN